MRWAMEGDIGGEVPCSSMAVDAVLRIGTVGNPLFTLNIFIYL